jgi:hypothetical protein
MGSHSYQDLNAASRWVDLALKGSGNAGKSIRPVLGASDSADPSRMTYKLWQFLVLLGRTV